MNMHERSWSIPLCVCVLAAWLGAGPAGAEGSLEDLLVEKGVITAEDREALQARDALAATPAPVDAAPEPGDEADWTDDLVVEADHKGLRIETADGQFTFAFGGRLQADGAVFIEDRSNLGDGAEMRRARIKSYGTVWGDWDYKLEVNFDPDLAVPITDGWIRYSGFDCTSLTVGHQKVPFSQESMTSSNWQVFQERSLIDAFIDNEESGRRRLGAVANSSGDWWSYRGGVFGGGLDDEGSQDEDWGLGHRIVVAPWAEKTRVLAFGGAVVYRDFRSQSDLRIRARPGSHIAGTRLVDTGVLATTDHDTMMNFSASGVYGPFHAQAEYTRSFTSRGGSARDVELDGWYVQAGVFLTGESRSYDLKSGEYKRPMPLHDYGAWELAARFDTIDLTDRDLRGGRQRDWSFAVNWWANANILFRVNYVYADADPNSGVTLGDQDEQAHAFMARAQIVF